MNHLAILLLAVDLLARKVFLNTIFRGFTISEGSESPAEHIKTLVQTHSTSFFREGNCEVHDDLQNLVIKVEVRGSQTAQLVR